MSTTGFTQEDLETVRPLAPFMTAGLNGLQSSRWRPGESVDELVAPIVLAVLVEVAKQLPLGEMTAALEAARGDR